jgi:DNA-binding transcriptional MocR family regulator
MMLLGKLLGQLWAVDPSFTPPRDVAEEVAPAEIEDAYSRPVQGSTDSAVAACRLDCHVTQAQDMLRRRCVALLTALDAHLADLADWIPPAAGMFLWVTLKPHLKDLPQGQALVGASEPRRTARYPFQFTLFLLRLLSADLMRKHQVVVFPGQFCAVPADVDHFSTSPFRSMRLSYVAPESTYDEAIRRLRGMLVEGSGSDLASEK